MNLVSKLYQWLAPHKEPMIPHYGRGVHALPNPEEHELFDKASLSFIQGDRLKGYEYFLSSLTHISAASHLTYSREGETLSFELYQGSAIIRGIVTHDALDASAIIANDSDLHVALKRRFLERNFQLTYGRFCNENGIIMLKLHLDNATVTPQKIFFPLREIALNADFEKEMIASEFDESLLLEYDHLRPLTENEYQRLYKWMMHWIEETKKSLVGLLSNDNSGMVSFSYLALLLQIDYLLIPRKKMAKEIAEKVNGYFLDDEKLTEDKNADLETFLAELEKMSLEKFSTQIYRSRYTFSPFDQAMHDEIASFIEESLNKVRWYKSNHANYVIGAIYRYIALYVLYNYGLHPSLRALLHLHVQIYAADFFEEMGETRFYDSAKKQFDQSAISEYIEASIEPYHERYKNLRNFSDTLNYSDLDHFSQSFYLQIKNLDFSEA